MFRFIAFLRAINVGGGRTVKMQSLRQVFESLGLSSVATFIASGNVVFETTTKEPKALERKIERALKAALGYEVRTFVRGEDKLAKIANYRPFPQSKFDETWQSNIIFLADNLDENWSKISRHWGRTLMRSRFTDERSTGGGAGSRKERCFLPFHLRKFSVLRSPSAERTQLKRLSRSTVPRSFAKCGLS
jgi:uncharacterized protein (DUF1697 family)